MNRREFVKYFLSYALLHCAGLNAGTTLANKVSISINGPLDDDLIVLKASSKRFYISKIFQMHNSTGIFNFNNVPYKILHNPGYLNEHIIQSIRNDEIILICTANERFDAESKLIRERTHYKSASICVNDEILIPSLLPEENSVPGYPLWFGEGEFPISPEYNSDKSLYNYYNLFDDSIVAMGLVFPEPTNALIFLYNETGNILYSYEHYITTKPKRLNSEEEKSGKLLNHPLVEVGNILNTNLNNQIENKNIITGILIITKESGTVDVSLPYPAMYPNQIYAVANQLNKKS